MIPARHVRLVQLLTPSVRLVTASSRTTTSTALPVPATPTTLTYAPVLGDSTPGPLPFQGIGCICNQPDQVYQDGLGCFACPPFSTFFPADYGNTCSCTDPAANFVVSDFQCECFGATYIDPAGSGACLPCGAGTNPNAYQGCFCEDQTQVLDPATINCITPVGPTAKAKRNRKREEKKKHLLLQSLKNVQDWSVFSHDVLCPSGQQACPILPSLASFECIDTSSEVDSCGGCVSLQEGVDCLSIPGVRSATCLAGTCHPLTCRQGWVKRRTTGGQACVKI